MLAVALAPTLAWGDEPAADPVGEPESDERGSANQADRAAAESLLKVGKGLMELGQLEEACDKLQGSIDAFFIGDAAILLAECQERRGLMASAWASYRQAAARLRQLEDARAPAVQQRADALNVKVPRLTLEATTVPGLVILRGETRFGDGVLGVPLAVDPGTHRIEARAPGHAPWSGEVTIRASERKSLIIPALKKSGATANGSGGVVDVERSAHGTLWTVGLVTGATGIVTIGVGALLGGLAAAEVSEAEDNALLCGDDRVCTPAGAEHIAGAERLAVASTVLFSVGGAALLTGFVMVLLDEPEPAELSATVTPWMGSSGGGLSVGGRF